MFKGLCEFMGVIKGSKGTVTLWTGDHQGKLLGC